MGFGAKYIGFIRTYYNDISSKVIINNFLADPDYPERDARQGCPLVPSLYMIGVKNLATMSVTEM